MTTLRPSVNDRDHQTGNLESKLTLVEYGDYQCPYCRRAHIFIQRALKAFNGELRFVFRHFPLKEIHKYAFTAAISAEAAGKQEKFWQMHDLLFDNQEYFHEKTRFLDLADELGLHLGQFIVDRKDHETAAKVEKDFTSGVYSGVSRTPTFFLNESKLYTYDDSYESLIVSIESFASKSFSRAERSYIS